MKKLYVFLVALLSIFTSMAQNVGIGTPTPNASALLDVSATDKGLLIPRMSKTQRTAIAAPANGLLVFQNAPDSIGLYYYNSGSWIWLQNASGAGSGWSTTGNAGTDTSVNFIGTTELKPLAFRVNNKKAGLISSDNTALGYYALNNAKNTAFWNTAIGYNTLANIENGAYNTALGFTAMQEFLNGSSNTGIGLAALKGLKNGNNNIGIGAQSSGITKGSNNIVFSNGNAVGLNTTDSLIDNVIIGNHPGNPFYLYSNKNVLVGTHAGGNLVYGGTLVAVGDSAAASNSTGFSNVALGAKALAKNTSKSNLVAVGDSALYNNGIGAGVLQAVGNTAVGSKSLFGNTTGSYNTSLGLGTLNNHAYGDDNTAVGASALAIGSSGTSTTAVGKSALQYDNGTNNVALGAYSMFYHQTGNDNVAIGYSALFNNINGNGNIAIGGSAALNEIGSNKLYIENSNADKNNALIYGDFAADSLNLNAKVNIRDYIRLGTQASGAPAIKMKKILIPVGPAVDGLQSYPMGSGITDAKVIGVQIFVTYAAPWKIPASYRDAAGFEFNYQVQANNIVIINKAGNSANIGAKPFTVLITYEE